VTGPVAIAPESRRRTDRAPIQGPNGQGSAPTDLDAITSRFDSLEKQIEAVIGGDVDRAAKGFDPARKVWGALVFLAAVAATGWVVSQHLASYQTKAAANGDHDAITKDVIRAIEVHTATPHSGTATVVDEVREDLGELEKWRHLQDLRSQRIELLLQTQFERGGYRQPAEVRKLRAREAELMSATADKP